MISKFINCFIFLKSFLGLADENESVREAALGAGHVLVEHYATTYVLSLFLCIRWPMLLIGPFFPQNVCKV